MTNPATVLLPMERTAKGAELVQWTRAVLDRSSALRTIANDYVAWRRQWSEALEEDPKDIERLLVTESFDWSGTGRGKHIQLGPDEEVPLNIGRHLGSGTTSEVHEVVRSDVTFAVKRRRVVRRNQRQDMAAFQREQANMERVNGHRHVVKIIGTFIHERVIGIVMWPVATCDLGTFFDDVDPLWSLYLRWGRNGCLSRDKIIGAIGAEGFRRLQSLQVLFCDDTGQCTCFFSYLRLERSFGCLAGALAYLHGQRVKHKDLKPSNILLTPHNIHITDFGTSTDFTATNVSATDSWGGTPKYFAPEVASYEPSGRAADVFSLGCIFVEMSYVHYGTPLERLQNLRENRDRSFHANLEHMSAILKPMDLSFPGAGVSQLVERMMATAPADRPSAAEVWSRFREISAQYGSINGSYNSDILFGSCCRELTILC